MKRSSAGLGFEKLFEESGGLGEASATQDVEVDEFVFGENYRWGGVLILEIEMGKDWIFLFHVVQHEVERGFLYAEEVEEKGGDVVRGDGVDFNLVLEVEVCIEEDGRALAEFVGQVVVLIWEMVSPENQYDFFTKVVQFVNKEAESQVGFVERLKVVVDLLIDMRFDIRSGVEAASISWSIMEWQMVLHCNHEDELVVVGRVKLVEELAVGGIVGDVFAIVRADAVLICEASLVYESVEAKILIDNIALVH